MDKHRPESHYAYGTQVDPFAIFEQPSQPNLQSLHKQSDDRRRDIGKLEFCSGRPHLNEHDSFDACMGHPLN